VIQIGNQPIDLAYASSGSAGFFLPKIHANTMPIR
jgi:hypothetical protein